MFLNVLEQEELLQNGTQLKGWGPNPRYDFCFTLLRSTSHRNSSRIIPASSSLPQMISSLSSSSIHRTAFHFFPSPSPTTLHVAHPLLHPHCCLPPLSASRYTQNIIACQFSLTAPSSNYFKTEVHFYVSVLILLLLGHLNSPPHHSSKSVTRYPHICRHAYGKLTGCRIMRMDADQSEAVLLALNTLCLYSGGRLSARLSTRRP